MRIQRRVPGVNRTHFSTAVIHRIEQAIIRECTKYGVSRSFVIANALAFTFGIDAEKYNEKQYNKKSKEMENVVAFKKTRRKAS